MGYVIIVKRIDVNLKLRHISDCVVEVDIMNAHVVNGNSLFWVWTSM